MKSKIIKPESEVPNCFLWQNEDFEFQVNVLEAPEKTYLIFGIFHLNRFDKKELNKKLDELLKTTSKHFSCWNENYPWSEYNCIKLSIEDTGTTFGNCIMGKICVEDNAIEEEKLIIRLLHELSTKLSVYEFIRICDTTGDFILSECYKQLPEEYEYPVSNNRLWLHEGSFKMIPLSFYPDRGLQPFEALEFLSKAHFKCIAIESLNKKIDETFTDGFPDHFYSSLVKLPLLFEDKTYHELFKENKQIVSFLIKKLLYEEIQYEEEPIIVNTDRLTKECFLIPEDFSTLLMLYLEKKSLKKDKYLIPLHSSRILIKILDMLIEEKDLQVIDSYQQDHVSTSIPIKCKHFHMSNFEDVRVDRLIEVPKENLMDSDFMKQLPDYLNFVTQDLNELDITDSVPTFGSNHGSTLSDTNTFEEDVNVKEYFKSNDIDIDEDDFFEYFLKEALKLDTKEVEKYKSQNVPTDNEQNSHIHNEEHNDMDDLDKLLIDNQIKSETSDNIKDLLHSMTEDGTPNELFESLLKNFSKENWR